MADLIDELVGHLSTVEREVLIESVDIHVPTKCASAPGLFDHQRRGESNATFEGRVTSAVALCAACPVLAHCDLKARLLGITGVVGGRYRPDPTSRAAPCHLGAVTPNPAQVQSIVTAAQTNAGAAGRWRTAVPSQ